MSELKVTSISHPSASAAGITLGSDGSVVLPSGFTGGIGTNVVSTTKTDVFSASVASGATSGDVTGLTATITPTSASSKLLVLYSVVVDGITAGCVVTLFRDGSVSDYRGDAAGSRTRASGHNVYQFAVGQSGLFLDNAVSTSPTTYSIRLRHDSGITRTLLVNRAETDTDGAGFFRYASTITVIEVAA